MPTETKKTEADEATVSAKVHDEVVAELAKTKEELTKCKESYETVVTVFNKLLQEYNEMHVAMLLKK